MVEHMEMDSFVARVFEIVAQRKGEREILFSSLCRYIEEVTKQIEQCHNKKVMVLCNFDALLAFVKKYHLLLEMEELHPGNHIVLKMKPGVMATILKHEFHCVKDVAILQQLENEKTIEKLIA